MLGQTETVTALCTGLKRPNTAEHTKGACGLSLCSDFCTLGWLSLAGT